jgi:hypothetical protein
VGKILLILDPKEVPSCVGQFFHFKKMSNPNLDISKFVGGFPSVALNFLILKPYGSEYGTILQAHFRN